jgi:hypothetical protein
MLNVSSPKSHFFSPNGNSLPASTPIQAFPVTSGRNIQFVTHFGGTQVNLQNLANELSSLRSNSASDAEKIILVENFAKKLFHQHGSQDELLKFAKLIGVKVFDQKDEPWVGKVLKKVGAGAAVDLPENLLGVPVDSRYQFKMPGMPPEYEAAFKQAEEKKYPLMFISSEKPSFLIRFLVGKDATLNMLKHEIFHLIQHNIGLPFVAYDPKIRFKADQIKAELLTGFAQANSGNLIGLYKGLRRFVIFKLDLMKMDLMAIFGRQQPQSQTSQETVGKALRYSFDRERDDYRFFIKYKDELNIDPTFVQFNKKSIKAYDQFEQYSRKYD